MWIHSLGWCTVGGVHGGVEFKDIKSVLLSYLKKHNNNNNNNVIAISLKISHLKKCPFGLFIWTSKQTSK